MATATVFDTLSPHCGCSALLGKLLLAPSTPHKTLVVVLKSDTIRSQADQHRSHLFAELKKPQAKGAQIKASGTIAAPLGRSLLRLLFWW